MNKIRELPCGCVYIVNWQTYWAIWRERSCKARMSEPHHIVNLHKIKQALGIWEEAE